MGLSSNGSGYRPFKAGDASSTLVGPTMQQELFVLKLTTPPVESERYRIYFRYYRYNTGRGDNGHYWGHMSASTIEESEKVASEILALDWDNPHGCPGGDWLARHYGEEGFLVAFGGIWKVNEEFVKVGP